MLSQSLRRWLAISCIAFITTACGGGGGSGGSNSGSSSASGSGSPTSGAPSNSPSSSPLTPGAAKNVALSWAIPTTRSDGSPLAASEILAYRLFYTREGSAANEDTIVVISNGRATNTSVSLAVAGTYTFVITAIDLNGSESQFSAPASIAIN